MEKQRGVNLVNSRKAVVLVGNKNDLEGEREVTQAQGKATALSWNIPSSSFLEVSAKERNTITVCFFLTVFIIEPKFDNFGEFLFSKKISEPAHARPVTFLT